METRDGFFGTANGVRFDRENRTENYVVIPPAYIITDPRGDVWTIGFKHNLAGEWEVMRNDRMTGEFASVIEMRAGVVSILSAGRRKRWAPSRDGRTGTFI